MMVVPYAGQRQFAVMKPDGEIFLLVAIGRNPNHGTVVNGDWDVEVKDGSVYASGVRVAEGYIGWRGNCRDMDFLEAKQKIRAEIGA